LVSLEYNYKIGGLAENQVAEAVKAVLSEPVLESKEVKKNNKIDNGC
jgi:phosphate transport system protein